ncbi:MAG: hypothetical protein RR087_04785, partial [Oscillospiraceae bacterium]
MRIRALYITYVDCQKGAFPGVQAKFQSGMCRLFAIFTTVQCALKQKGYDVATTAKWLQNFYL